MIEGSCLCGGVRWQYDGVPDSALSCSCTACRRSGALWAYAFLDQGIRVSGSTQAYVRGDSLEFHFCPVCSNLAYWRGLNLNAQGQRRMAVNLRLAEPEAVGPIPIRRNDGLNDFASLPSGGRTVHDVWF
ncbi:GFA family protein [soil metagenome]